jgi:hypothetical protein
MRTMSELPATRSTPISDPARHESDSKSVSASTDLTGVVERAARSTRTSPCAAAT